MKNFSLRLITFESHFITLRAFIVYDKYRILNGNVPGPENSQTCLKFWLYSIFQQRIAKDASVGSIQRYLHDPRHQIRRNQFETGRKAFDTDTVDLNFRDV